MSKTRSSQLSNTSAHTLFVSSKLVRLAAAVSGKRSELISDTGLLPGCDEMLLALLSNDGVTMGVLAELTETSASSTAKTAAKLETRGLIRRESSRIDSRQNHAFLTESGSALAQTILERYTGLETGLGNSLKGKELERLFTTLEKIDGFISGKKQQKLKKPKKAGRKKNGDKTSSKPKKKK